MRGVDMTAIKRLIAHIIFGSIVAMIGLAATVFTPFAAFVDRLLDWAEKYVEKDIDNGH